jgi:hypothetical protein
MDCRFLGQATTEENKKQYKEGAMKEIKALVGQIRGGGGDIKSISPTKDTTPSLSCKSGKMRSVLTLLTASFILLVLSFTFSSCKPCNDKDNNQASSVGTAGRDDPKPNSSGDNGETTGGQTAQDPDVVILQTLKQLLEEIEQAQTKAEDSKMKTQEARKNAQIAVSEPERRGIKRSGELVNASLEANKATHNYASTAVTKKAEMDEKAKSMKDKKKAEPLLEKARVAVERANAAAQDSEKAVHIRIAPPLKREDFCF